MIHHLLLEGGFGKRASGERIVQRSHSVDLHKFFCSRNHEVFHFEVAYHEINELLMNLCINIECSAQFGVISVACDNMLNL